MRVRELYNELDARMPRSLSCEWDNDGLMCCPDSDKVVKKALIALDVTGAVVDYAKKEGYDVIISHHPFIFNGLKSIDDTGYVTSKVLKVIESKIAVMSFHTRLDAVNGGVNDKLCELFGLYDIEVIMTDGSPIGRIGTLTEKMSAEDFAKKVKEILGAPFVNLAEAGVETSRVALVGGGGGSFISAARDAGADTYVSGDIGYHALTDAPDFKNAPLNLIEVGHFYSEHPVCEVLKNMIGEIAPDVACDVYYSNVIKAI